MKTNEQKLKGEEWRCPKCKHKQITKSKLSMITCSDCQRKSNREDNLINKKIADKINGSKK